MHRYFLLLTFCFITFTIQAQSPKKDRSKANKNLLEARIFRAEGAYKQSSILLREAMSMYAEMGMWVKYCGAKKLLINNFEIAEEWDSVRVLQEDLLKESVKYLGKNNRFEKQGYTTLGEAYVQSNQPDFAIPFLEEGLGLIDGKAIGKEEEKTKIYTLLGMAYELRAEHSTALFYFEKAGTYIESNKVLELPIVAQWNYNYAAALFRSRQLEKALIYAEKSLLSNQVLYTPNSRKSAASLVMLAEIQAALGQYNSAIEQFNKAISILSLSNINPSLLVDAYRKKGISMGEAGNIETAEASLKKAIEVSLKTFGKKHPQTADCYLAKAELSEKTGDIAQGLDCVIQGISALIPFGNDIDADLRTTPVLNTLTMLQLLQVRQQLLFNKFIKNKETSDLEAIVTSALKAEEFRWQVQAEHFNLYIRHELNLVYQKIYTAAIGAQLDLAILKNPGSKTNNYQQALIWAERAKQLQKRSLLFINAVRSTGALPEQQKEEEIKLLKKTARLKYDLTNNIANVPKAVSALKTEWAGHLKEFDQWLSALKQSNPRYHEYFYKSPDLNLGDLQSKLGGGKRLLVFIEGTNAYYRFWIDEKNIAAKSIPKSDEQEASLNWITGYLADSEAAKDATKLQQFAKASTQLYTSLLGDIIPESDTAIQHLHIVADGALQLLPFELLLSSVPEGITTQWPYLLKHVSIQYFWTIGDLLRPAHEKIGSKLLLANTNYKNLPPLRGLRDLYKSAQDWSSGGNGNKYRRYFKGKFQLNLEATERNLTQTNFSDFAAFQPAFYADFSEAHPMLSRILLSYEADSLFDGAWHAYEISNLFIPVQLLVLSSVGDSLLLNDSKAALLLAFEYAGAEATLWPLWKQNEADERKIIQLYYENLAAGLSKTKALRQAKIQFLEANGGLKAAPHYWASFMLTGTDGPVAIETRYRFPWIPVSIAALILLGILALLWRRKRAKKALA